MKDSRIRFVTPLIAALFQGLLLIPATHAAEARDLSPIEVARKLNDAFAEIVDKVSPAVVVIHVSPDDRPKAPKADEKKKEEEKPKEDATPEPAEPGDGSGDEGKGDPSKRRDAEPFEQWFRRQMEERRRERVEGHGSGVVIRPDGYILTNAHVIEDAYRIEVRFKDGRAFKGEVAGVDERSDLAVVKINATGLTTAPLGDSSRARVGEFAIAIGAPFELDYTVTFGHVSAKGRSDILPDSMMDQDYVQTDASINPGNSGGPLVNIDGEVIGINTIIRGIGTGIGFAVPSNLARKVSDQLIAKGRFTRSWLGISIRELEDYPRLRQLAEDTTSGVVVTGTDPRGPATKSGLRPGDVIVALNGRPVANVRSLQRMIRTETVGEDLTLGVVRINGKLQPRATDVKVAPAEWPDARLADSAERRAPGESEAKALGLAVKSLSEELSTRHQVPADAGVIVTDPMGRRWGLLGRPLGAGDIITRIDGKRVKSVEDFKRITTEVDIKQGVLIQFVSDDPSDRGWNKFEVLYDLTGF